METSGKRAKRHLDYLGELLASHFSRQQLIGCHKC